MIENMVRKAILVATITVAGLLVGCGTSTTGPDGGSKQMTMTGVSSSGYPAGDPKDPSSPALASTSETKYSREEPKAGVAEGKPEAK